MSQASIVSEIADDVKKAYFIVKTQKSDDSFHIMHHALRKYRFHASVLDLVFSEWTRTPQASFPTLLKLNESRLRDASVIVSSSIPNAIKGSTNENENVTSILTMDTSTTHRWAIYDSDNEYDASGGIKNGLGALLGAMYEMNTDKKDWTEFVTSSSVSFKLDTSPVLRRAVPATVFNEKNQDAVFRFQKSSGSDGLFSIENFQSSKSSTSSTSSTRRLVAVFSPFAIIHQSLKLAEVPLLNVSSYANCEYMVIHMSTAEIDQWVDAAFDEIKETMEGTTVFSNFYKDSLKTETKQKAWIRSALFLDKFAFSESESESESKSMLTMHALSYIGETVSLTSPSFVYTASLMKISVHKGGLVRDDYGEYAYVGLRRSSVSSTGGRNDDSNALQVNVQPFYKLLEDKLVAPWAMMIVHKWPAFSVFPKHKNNFNQWVCLMSRFPKGMQSPKHLSFLERETFLNIRDNNHQRALVKGAKQFSEAWRSSDCDAILKKFCHTFPDAPECKCMMVNNDLTRRAFGLQEFNKMTDLKACRSTLLLPSAELAERDRQTLKAPTMTPYCPIDAAFQKRHEPAFQKVCLSDEAYKKRCFTDENGKPTKIKQKTDACLSSKQCSDTIDRASFMNDIFEKQLGLLKSMPGEGGIAALSDECVDREVQVDVDDAKDDLRKEMEEQGYTDVEIDAWFGTIGNHSGGAPPSEHSKKHSEPLKKKSRHSVFFTSSYDL